MRQILFAAFLCGLPVTAQACTGPACCVVYGVAAVCRSSVVEERARGIVMRRCPRCLPSDVTDWIFSYQMNRGPYESAGDLAGDVLRAMGRRSDSRLTGAVLHNECAALGQNNHLLRIERAAVNVTEFTSAKVPNRSNVAHVAYRVRLTIGIVSRA